MPVSPATGGDDRERLPMNGYANRAVVPAYVLVRQLDGESVLLNLATERYFGLDSMGTRRWETLTTSASIQAAYGKLLEEFDVEPALLRGHLDELLGRLKENGLLHLLPADVGTNPAI